MLLAVDIGNRNASCGIFEGKKLIRTWRIQEPTSKKRAYLKGCLFAGIGGKLQSIEGVSICSVVPSVDKFFGAILGDELGVDPLFVNHKNAGMVVRGYNSGQLGADRLVAAVAAYERFKKAAVIVDAGSAITIDLVNAKGEFRGGAIAPGLGMGAESLHDASEKLPLVRPAFSRIIKGTNTRTAINSGIVHGFAGLVDGLVEGISREAIVRPVVVATGGDAKLLGRACKSIRYVRPHLVLEGLRIVWMRNR